MKAEADAKKAQEEAMGMNRPRVFAPGSRGP